MKPKLQIVSFEEVQLCCRSVELAPVTLYLTSEVLEAIGSTVGSKPPETGAKLFGPSALAGADVLEFDVRGSARAGQAVYTPDSEWGDKRLAYWLLRPDADQRLWTGDVHSHPNGYGLPSSEVGEGLGDLGYARAVLEAVEWMEHFFFPIITGALSGEPHLWPWVMTRDRLGEAQYAQVVVGDVSDFPPRQFRSSWSTAVGGQTPTPDTQGLTWTMPLDLEEVAELSRSALSRRDQSFLFERAGTGVLVALPADFPRSGPKVEMVLAGRQVPLGVRWRRRHQTRAEIRLKRVVEYAFICASREF